MEHIDAGLLARFYDGESDAQASQRVARHLAACVECREELAALRAVSALLAGQPDAATSDDPAAFWAALQPRLGEQVAAPRLWLSWLPGLLLLGLLVLVLVAGGVTTGLWLLQASGLAPVGNPGLLPWGSDWLISGLSALPFWPGRFVTGGLGLVGQLGREALGGGLTAVVNATNLLATALILWLMYMAWLAAWCVRFCAQPAIHTGRVNQ